MLFALLLWRFAELVFAAAEDDVFIYFRRMDYIGFSKENDIWFVFLFIVETFYIDVGGGAAAGFT